MNRMGFNKKKSNDKVLYTVLVIMLFLFIFNMKDIYQFVSKLKTGELFETKKEEEVEKTPVKEEENVYSAVKPEGSDYVVCSKEDSQEGGTLTSTVKLYYTDFKLKSIVEDLQYDGDSEDYINYVYSENNKFKKRQTNNKDVEGYSVIPDATSQTTLKVNSVYVLSKVALTDIKLEDDETLDLAGVYNQNTTELTTDYQNLGYKCEW